MRYFLKVMTDSFRSSISKVYFSKSYASFKLCEFIDLVLTTVSDWKDGIGALCLLSQYIGHI